MSAPGSTPSRRRSHSVSAESLPPLQESAVWTVMAGAYPVCDEDLPTGGRLTFVSAGRTASCGGTDARLSEKPTCLYSPGSYSVSWRSVTGGEQPMTGDSRDVWACRIAVGAPGRGAGGCAGGRSAGQPDLVCLASGDG